MILRSDVLDGLEAGTVDVAFRRWDRPRVKVGSRLRTRIGLVEVTSVDEVAEADVRALGPDDARRAGAASPEELQEGLADPPDRPVWRVGLRHAGPDPREQLREQVPDAEELDSLLGRLERLDRAASYGAWTRATLDLVDEHPERRAPELAELVGRETAPFKRDVRKLKELGLTESLAIGYRLSPRGEAVLDAARRRDGLPVRRRTGRRQGTPLPQDVGAPATRALRAAGMPTLEQVAGRDRAELATLHGVGPIALERLDRALAHRGLDPLV